MDIYVNLLGTWTLLTDDDNINGANPIKFAEDFFIDNERYKDSSTICVTHDYIRYVIPICYLQIKNY